jgi:hypothetical protein
MGQHRPNEPLQCEFADGLGVDQVFHRGERPLADQDFAVGGLVAQARGEIRHRTDRGVVEPPLETDPAERGITLRDTDSEAKPVAMLVPGCRRRSGGAAARA